MAEKKPLAEPPDPPSPPEDAGPAEPPQPWTAGAFAANTRALVRKLRAWAGVDFQSPFRTLAADDPQVLVLNRRTFRESIQPFSSVPRPEQGWRLVSPPTEERDGVACLEPERDADKPLTLWFLGEFARQIESAPPTAAFDHLRGLFEQLLETPAWIALTQRDGQDSFSRMGIAEDDLVAAGRMVNEDIVSAIEEAASHLLDPAIPPLGGAPGEGNEKPTSPTVRAAFAIVKQQQGKGISAKELIRLLKEQNIQIAESSFRKHIVPELKLLGVDNHRSRGGYYLAPAA